MISYSAVLCPASRSALEGQKQWEERGAYVQGAGRARPAGNRFALLNRVLLSLSREGGDFACLRDARPAVMRMRWRIRCDIMMSCHYSVMPCHAAGMFTVRRHDAVAPRPMHTILCYIPRRCMSGSAIGRLAAARRRSRPATRDTDDPSRGGASSEARRRGVRVFSRPAEGGRGEEAGLSVHYCVCAAAH